MNINDVPDEAFIKVVKVRDILKARPVTPEERKNIKRGGPDIYYKTLDGRTGLMERKEVTNNFTYANGMPIKIFRWQSKNSYLITCPDEDICLAIHIPTNKTINVKGKEVSGYNYVICRTNNDGSINKQSAYIIPDDLFRKVFYIRKADLDSYNQGVNRRTSKPTNIAVVKSVKYDSEVPQTSKIINKPTGMVHANIQDERYSIVAQLVNDVGIRVGFAIRNNAGQIKAISRDVACKLCENGKISNLEIVKSANGAVFFRGNGVRLEDIPIKEIK